VFKRPTETSQGIECQ